MSDGSLRFDTRLDVLGFQDGANRLGDIVKGITVFKVLEAGMKAVTASIDDAISRYDTLNRFPKVLEQMGYSADQAQVATKKLADGVTGLPTSLDEVVSTAQRLTVLTGNLELATDTTLALNNAFYASGSTAADASRGLNQYVQMLSTGKVDMVSWRTLQETMGYALQKTAEAFGFAGASAQNDLYAALKEGDITFDQFNRKLVELNDGVGGFAEVARAATGGIGTAWTNLQIGITKGVTGIIEAIDSGLSETRFKSIENVIAQMSETIKGILAGLADAFKFLASNIDIIVPSVIAFFAAWKITTLLSFIGQAGSVTAAITAMTTAIKASSAAKVIDAAQTAYLHVLYAKDAILKGASTVATVINTAAENGNVVAIAAKTVATGASTVATGIATAAQWAWNAAMMANPIGLIIAGIVALVAAIAGFIFWLAGGTEEYKKQKEEVDALAKAQKEQVKAIEESEAAYQSASAEIDAHAEVCNNLVGKIREIKYSTEDAAVKNTQMESTLKQLNGAMDGLNIAYDKESNTLKNINTGQTISIEQLEQLVKAKNDLAKANAWQERANELLKEQIKISENLAVVEAKKKEIEENSILSTKEKNKLLKELNKSEEEYAQAMEDVERRITVADQKIAESNTEMAQKVVDNYEIIYNQVTKNGENIYQVAEAWGVSVDKIEEEILRDGGNLDDWVTKNEQAWAAYEETVKARVDGVINGFKKIPTEFSQSAQEMLDILIKNKETYAQWEANMEEITRQLGPTAAEEFRKLGPEANSAMEEILGSAELLDKYREIFGVKIDEVTGEAIEDWSDPAFIGAPSDAIDKSAEEVTANESLPTAVKDKVQEASDAAREAMDEVDFTEVGRTISKNIQDGVSSVDMSAVMNSIVEAIAAGASSVDTAINNMCKAVQDAFDKMSTQTKTIISDMMKEMSSLIKQGGDDLKSKTTDISDGVTKSWEPMVSGAKDAASNMMDGILSAMTNKAQTLYNKASEIANKIAATMRDALKVESPSKVMIGIFENVMMGVYVGMDNLKDRLYKQADKISGGIIDGLTISPQAAETIVGELALHANALGSPSGVSTTTNQSSTSITNQYYLDGQAIGVSGQEENAFDVIAEWATRKRRMRR